MLGSLYIVYKASQRFIVTAGRKLFGSQRLITSDGDYFQTSEGELLTWGE